MINLPILDSWNVFTSKEIIQFELSGKLISFAGSELADSERAKRVRSVFFILVCFEY
jgi:hypothetical protein